MKKKIVAALMFPLLLCSCSANNYTGIYSFQLGKVDGTHMYAKLNLTDVDFIDEKAKEDDPVKKYYILEISMNMGLDSSIIDIIANVLPKPSDPTDQSGTDIIADEDDTVIAVGGYYYIADPVKDGGHEMRLNIELDFNSMIQVDESDEEEEKEENSDDYIIDIPDHLIESVVYATVYESEVKLAIPVSLEDLFYQLYWYGYDFNSETYEIVLEPVDGHPFGSHPTADEIQAINDAGFPDTHVNPFTGEKMVFRDYNTVHLGLTKE